MGRAFVTTYGNMLAGADRARFQPLTGQWHSSKASAESGNGDGCRRTYRSCHTFLMGAGSDVRAGVARRGRVCKYAVWEVRMILKFIVPIALGAALVSGTA